MSPAAGMEATRTSGDDLAGKVFRNRVLCVADSLHAYGLSPVHARKFSVARCPCPASVRSADRPRGWRCAYGRYTLFPTSCPPPEFCCLFAGSKFGCATLATFLIYYIREHLTASIDDVHTQTPIDPWLCCCSWAQVRCCARLGLSVLGREKIYILTPEGQLESRRGIHA